MDEQEIIEIIHTGGVGVYPTDTLYGLVGSALLPDTVDRIYDLKRRDPNKPLIVLIRDISDLEQFGVELSESLVERLTSYWPGPNSIILPVIDDQFEYLSRGTDSIAFRLPDKESLRDLLEATGPLVAPSANVEGLPPAPTIEEARRFFGTDVDFYIDEGELDGNPSSVMYFEGDEVVPIRE